MINSLQPHSSCSSTASSPLQIEAPQTSPFATSTGPPDAAVLAPARVDATNRTQALREVQNSKAIGGSPGCPAHGGALSYNGMVPQWVPAFGESQPLSNEREASGASAARAGHIAAFILFLWVWFSSYSCRIFVASFPHYLSLLSSFSLPNEPKLVVL
ncbi:hypothetical protein MVEN_00864900 [Mycena venus]|uniref:Uncharacterized protein n=1 Tax=Mycena venus TaxID=2733690 RepID=A0A8H7D1L5_9AGAR|nr:hypothetical protein MVEN_00864900 [Mycena venus]